MTVQQAHRAIRAAEAKVSEARQELAEAREQLDVALAERGWRRQHGGFDAALYSHALSGGHLITLNDVLAHELAVNA
jgi:multidrug resistance efflux pump